MELIGPYLAGSLLLVGAGMMKTFRPGDTARAVYGMVPARIRPYVGLRTVRGLLVAGAAVETAIGVAALVAPRPVTAWLVAASYAAFGGVVVRALASGGAVATCGCFGRPDTPATVAHLVVNVAVGIAAVLVALAAPSGGTLAQVIAHQPMHGVPLLAASGLACWLAFLVLGALARLQGARTLLGVTHRRWD